MAQIEVKRAPDGRPLARRTDGKPLTPVEAGPMTCHGGVRQMRSDARNHQTWHWQIAPERRFLCEDLKYKL